MLNKINNFYINGYSYSETAVEDYFTFIQASGNIIKLAANINGKDEYLCNQLDQSNAYYWYKDLKDDEIILSAEDFRRLFPDKYSSDFSGIKYLDDPFEIEVSSYSKYDKTLNHRYETNKIKVVGYANQETTVVSPNTFIKLMHPYISKPSKILMDNPKDDLYIYDNLCNEEISISLNEEEMITTGERYVDVLSKLFKFIFYILLALILLGIVFYVIKVVKNKIFEIGVMKALGARDLDIILEIGINIFFTTIMLLIFYDVFEIILVNKVNGILVNSIKSVEIGISCFYPGYKIIMVTPSFLLITDVIIVFIMILSLVIPYIKLRRLKPTNIIKAKE